MTSSIMPETDSLAGIKQLDVRWENAASVHADRKLTMQLRVTGGWIGRSCRPPHLSLCSS